ncbi:MAG TPA: Hpt domain-containing protein [Caulobacteraceae bacterium]|jgi:hypothetical protein
MARRDITGAVDFAYLENYAAGDMALVDEVLGLFREQVELWRPMIDPEAGRAWGDAVHTLKGAARGIGAFALADACDVAEKSEKEPERSPPLLALVHDALDAALGDVAAYQHERLLQGLRNAS